MEIIIYDQIGLFLWLYFITKVSYKNNHKNREIIVHIHIIGWQIFLLSPGFKKSNFLTTPIMVF